MSISSSDSGKIGVIAATLMVASNIMGSGVFMLPANLAAAGGIAIFGWVITIIGAVALALTYAKMSSLDSSAGGQYAYAKRAFGPWAGYQVNTVYWLACWVGNIAMVVVGIGYLSYFFPILKEPIPLTIASIALLWLFVGINMVGPRFMTKVQGVTAVIALVPIIGVAIGGWFWFKGSVYMDAWNVSGKSDFSAIQSVLNVTLWSFIGVETASVAAAVVKNPKKNVPIATVGGVLIAAVSYVLSCTAIMGIIPNEALQKSAAPFADAVKIALGNDAGAIITLAAAIGCLGSLGGWVLAAGQTAKAAADDKLFHPIFGKVNSKGVPIAGLLIVGILMTAFALTSISPSAADEFGTVSSVTVLFTIIPYLYTCAALLLLGHGHLANQRALYTVFMSAAFIFCLWAIVGSEPIQVVWCFVVAMAILWLYSTNYNRNHPNAYPLDTPLDKNN